MKVNTVMIQTANGPVRINASDYDPDVHELVAQESAAGEGSAANAEATAAAADQPAASVFAIEERGGGWWWVVDRRTGNQYGSGVRSQEEAEALKAEAEQAEAEKAAG